MDPDDQPDYDAGEDVELEPDVSDFVGWASALDDAATAFGVEQ